MRQSSDVRSVPRALSAMLGVLAALAISACGSSSTNKGTPDAGHDAGSGNVGAKVGSPCTMASQCDSRTTPACLTAIKPLANLAGVKPDFANLGLNFPNGYCSNAITPYCASDAECGNGGACFRPFAMVDSATLRDLEPPLGVSAGTLDFLPQYGVCLAKCTSTADCSAGEMCTIPMQDFISQVPGSVNNTPYCVTVPGCESCSANAMCELNYDGAGNNRCACNPGYTGDGMTCTAVSGACSTNPCQNGSTCTSGSGTSYTCTCINGYTGTNCDIAPVTASVPIGGPCISDAECNVPNGPHCYTTGYSATGVPLDIKPLYDVLKANGITSPLRNVGLTFPNGYCSNMNVETSTYCTADLQCGPHGGCLAPFRNVTAQTWSDLAATLPPLAPTALDFLSAYGVCLRSCIDNFDCVGGTDVCQVPMPDLISQVPGSDNTKTYCVPGPMGCQLCDNNAYCSVDANGTGSCVCRAGYTGSGLTCVAKSTPACADNPCQNGGTCTDGANQTYVCACATGYTGTNCQIKIIPPGCVSDPCHNGGTCDGPLTAGSTTYTCTCPTGYSGTNCDTYVCAPNPCKNGGACQPSGTSFACTCPTGFTGADCSTAITCPTAVAPTNGTVSGSSTAIGATITYACNSGYAMTGSASATCQSTGATTADWSSAAPTCTATTSACASNPCLNGGTCSPSGSSYTCSCANGYSGTTCQTAADCGALTGPTNGTVATAPNTLVGATATYACNSGYTISGSNTRTCSGTGVGTAAWSGTAPTCVMNTTNPCSPNPCLNGGTCTASGSTAVCACAAGYSGTTCQTPVTCTGATAPTNGTVSAASATYPNSVTYACNAGYTLSGTAMRACGSNGSWTTAAPTCTANACPTLTAPTNGTVTPTTGTTGTTATYACNTGYALSGGATRTCQTDGTWSGTAPTCAASSCGMYTDVVYAITAGFAIKGTTLGIGNQSFSGLKANNTTPLWGTNGGSGDKGPFDRPPTYTPTTFTRGFARLRFTNDSSGNPIAGTVRLVEWYVPMEFHQTAGATVDADVDHSVGIIDNTLVNCGGGDAACANHAPGLNRTCASNATGTLSGTTLTWGTCSPSPSGSNSWSFVNARAVTGAGCATGYNAYGNTRSTSSLVPSSGKGDSYQTWNQQLKSFTFSGTNYKTATWTMPEMQIPNGTNASNTWLQITSSTVITTACGSTPGTDLVCNVQ